MDKNKIQEQQIKMRKKYSRLSHRSAKQGWSQQEPSAMRSTCKQTTFQCGVPTDFDLTLCRNQRQVSPGTGTFLNITETLHLLLGLYLRIGSLLLSCT